MKDLALVYHMVQGFGLPLVVLAQENYLVVDVYCFIVQLVDLFRIVTTSGEGPK